MTSEKVISPPETLPPPPPQIEASSPAPAPAPPRCSHRGLCAPPPALSGEEGRCKATWKREFKLPWCEAGPPNHLDEKVDSDK